MMEMVSHEVFRRIREERDAALEALRQAEERLTFRDYVWPTLGLSAQRSRLLNCLMARDFCTYDALLHALDTSAEGPEQRRRMCHVVLCHVRKALECRGIRIERRIGIGCWLPPAEKQKLLPFRVAA